MMNLNRYKKIAACVAILISALVILSVHSCGYTFADTSARFEEGENLSGGDLTVFDHSVNAFSLPAPKLNSDDELDFFVGNSFFNQNWVMAPSSTTARDGLGPYFNARSCSGCHFKDGRGQPPATIGQLSNGMILRLSVPGKGPHNEPLPEKNYGAQFHEHAITNVNSEGNYEIVWKEIPGAFPDGKTYSLRQPLVQFSNLNYGEMDAGVMISPRTAPQMCGLGLLEAIPESAILAYADPVDSDGDGVSGRPNYVWNSIEQKQQLGRFGWKANQPTLLQQIAAAFHGDMGISTEYFPAHNIDQASPTHINLPDGGSPEIEAADLAKVHLYTSTLAVPARRDAENKDVLKGKKIFLQAGCNSCHIEKMTTAEHGRFPVLSNQVIRPYTDLLLHDMGEGLADGRPDFEATGTEWRTPPLWGIGLIETVNGHSYYLHDGRARNLTEAILWHGGEADPAKNYFIQLEEKDRESLLTFLRSL